MFIGHFIGTDPEVNLLKFIVSRRLEKLSIIIF